MFFPIDGDLAASRALIAMLRSADELEVHLRQGGIVLSLRKEVKVPGFGWVSIHQDVAPVAGYLLFDGADAEEVTATARPPLPVLHLLAASPSHTNSATSSPARNSLGVR